MLQAILERLRHDGEPIRICFAHHQQAKVEWLALGGAESDIFTMEQLKQCVVSAECLPDEILFCGSVQEWLSMPFLENKRAWQARMNESLSGAIVECQNGKWECYRGNVVVKACCVGEYFSLVNKKEIKNHHIEKLS